MGRARRSDCRGYSGPLLLLAAMCGCAAIGCDAGPRAPVLRDAAVFQDNREGFRFLVPDGWTNSARANLPDGPLEGEVVLVQYRMRTSAKGASLEILCFDDDPSLDLHAYHAGPSHGHQQWDSVEPPQSVNINSKDAEQFLYSVKADDNTMLKDVVTFRENGRTYSFIGLLWDDDVKARQQIRRAVQSVVWK